eukprot:2013835-Rhodomonas_salina.1
MQPKLCCSSAAGKQPKDEPPPLAFKYDECTRSALLDAKISTQKVWVHFVKHNTAAMLLASFGCSLASSTARTATCSTGGRTLSLSLSHKPFT